MARVKLTAGRIADFSTDKGQAFLWDTEAPGLAVRATAGAKAYIFQAKLNGQAIRITIGDVRAWLLDSSNPEQPGARQEARRLQGLIDQGTDPREQKRERIAATEAKRAERRRQDVTMGEAWAGYVEARKHKWSPRHLADHSKQTSPGGVQRKRRKGLTEPGPLAALVHLKLSDLTDTAIADWLKKETAKRPTYAALGYRLLRAFMRWAADHDEYAGAIHANAATSRKVKDHVPSVKTKEGDVLQREQLAPWFKAVRQLSNPVQSAYLQILLLTGPRREELAALKWADVDFQWKSLTIHDKVEGERVIPLTPYVAALLRDLKKRNDTPPPQYRILKGKKLENDLENWKPSPWVFSSGTAGAGYIREPRAAHTRALAAAGLPHVSLHGLRRSFGTLAEWVEAPTGIVAQIQGHKPSALAEKHYRRRPLDLLRMWHSRIEAWMLEQAGIEQPKEEAEGLRLMEGGSRKNTA